MSNSRYDVVIVVNVIVGVAAPVVVVVVADE